VYGVVFGGDTVIILGGQLLLQKGKCKNECGEWEWKTRNCLCFCVGISAGVSIGGEICDDSDYPEGWEAGLGPISFGSGTAGVGAGLKIGFKYCWCTCDIF